MADELFTREGGAPRGAVQLDAKGRPFFTERRKCSRCGGAGHADKWIYTGRVCFDCNGSGWSAKADWKIQLYTADELERLNASRDKVRARKAEKHAALMAQANAERQSREVLFNRRYGELMDRAARYGAARYGDDWRDSLTSDAPAFGSDFILDVAQKAMNRAEITDPQAAALVKALDRWDAEQARKAVAKHVGSLGERLELEVTVERVSSFQRPKFGANWLNETVHIVSMRAGADALVTFTTSAKVPEQGARRLIRGTVDKHDTFRNEAQTTLKRVTFKELPGA